MLFLSLLPFIWPGGFFYMRCHATPEILQNNAHDIMVIKYTEVA